MDQEITADLLRQEPKLDPFDLLAGIPFGGLHLAAALSLRTKVPMIYVTPRGANGEPAIEGRYKPGQTVLLIDDLITTGGSVLETGPILQDAGLKVAGAFVLVDRGQGAARRLQQHGYHLMTLLNLRVMLNYYMSTGTIGEDWYRRSIAYLDEHPALPA
jgi:orotate phosphoribosyltransferase/uridine monophosphate synthetase